MIAVTTASAIEGYQVMAYKGTGQGASFEELLCNAESLGANAILNTFYDSAVDVDTLFHGAAVVIEPVRARGEIHPIPKLEVLKAASLGEVDGRKSKTSP
jgi:uncharacterized protein YbjQ (UPF0145 family)